MIRIIRTTAFALALLFPLSAFAAPSWAGSEAQVYDVGVDGLGCPFCAYGIEKELGSLKGVHKVAVDIKRGVVIVTMTSGATLDRATAKKAVENAGFDLRSFKRVSEE